MVYAKYIMADVDFDGDLNEQEEFESEEKATTRAKKVIADDELEPGSYFVIYKAVRVIKISNVPVIENVK